MLRQFSAIIRKEDDMYVALCPELDITSQGKTIEESRSNLREAIDFFFQYSSEQEIKSRYNNEIYLTQIEVFCLSTVNN